MRKVEALRQELELDDDLLSDSDTYTEANGSASVSGAASPFPIVDDAHTLPLADETNDGPAQCGDVNTQPSDLNTNHVSDDDRIGEPESGGALADKEASGCEGKALAYATPAKGKKKKKKNINRHGGETVDDVALQAALDALDVRNNESDDEKPQKKKKGRRAAKGAKATTENICGSTTESSNTERGTKSKAKAKVSAEVNACSVCDAEFDTRNEVFRHLETAHEMRKGGKQKGKRR
ncbi:hypothetical protein SARC_11899 [Sphaeroforma arctica JP610]|uniref:C2H2-type domain-containing protein n=1 Tax=Sphaeroforma arctica JP610 TaxID=667725 RepID=A0A0L0FHU4_9EUKA|nr:hypothetical protein SARC_11899 [Sphaeroforma arctica JP610]KNC75578.1 hypothetical protein SARC_11899 [Sphaeroforma arctica JP610]|eukprot:XP_014149480.1 hypothetical protein SARC_11899 [Sphaeroforma arctica JP610]